MSLAEVCTPVSGCRSTIQTFSCQRNARLRPRPSRLVPTTWPSGFTAFAWLTAPPSVPRSWIDTSTTGGAGTRGTRSDRGPATELRASPQPSLHGGFGRRSIESLYQDGGATVPADGDHVEDRDLALGRTVPQSQLGAARFARGPEPDARPRPSVVIVDPRLQDVHGILLSLLLHPAPDRKSTRLNSSHGYISYAVFCLKKKKTTEGHDPGETVNPDGRLAISRR